MNNVDKIIKACERLHEGLSIILNKAITYNELNKNDQHISLPMDEIMAVVNSGQLLVNMIKKEVVQHDELKSNIDIKNKIIELDGLIVKIQEVPIITKYKQLLSFT